MSLSTWWRRLWLFIHRDRARRELEDEMQLHRDLRARELERASVPSADAAVIAKRRFGHEPTHVAESQSSWGFHHSDEVTADVRYAIRRMRTRPWYAAAVMLMMGLGIGATTAMFSAIDSVMLRALPLGEPNRLVMLPSVEVPFASGPGQPVDQKPTLELPAIQGMPELFSSAASFAAGRLNLSDVQRPLRIRVGVVTDGFFHTLGVSAAVGRTFVHDDGIPGAPPVVILSDAFWRRQYGAKDILGQRILIDDRSHQVIGIMNPGFSFPEESDLWIPMSTPNTPVTFAAFGGYVPSRTVARLAPNVDLESANRRLLDRWQQALSSAEIPAIMREGMNRLLMQLKSRGAVRPLQASLAGTQPRALLALSGAAALLLVIAFANAAILLVSEALTRTREAAMRVALGASRGRILRQMLTESMVLSVGGAAIGIVMTPLLLGALRPMLPSDLAGIADPRLDWRVLSFASALGLAMGIVIGLWPAHSATRTDPADVLKSGAVSSARRGSARGRRALITVELALTLVLLIGSGLMFRTLASLLNVEPGIQTANTAMLEIPFTSTTPRAARIARIGAILDRLRHSAGILSAAATSDFPLGGGGTALLLGPTPGGDAPPPSMRGARYTRVSPGYFETLGIRLRGEDFTISDDSIAPPHVIISEALARRWFPGVDPIGRQLMSAGGKTPFTVIGVAADVHTDGLDAEIEPEIYQSAFRAAPRSFALIARGNVHPGALLNALRDAVHAVDSTQAVDRARMMDRVVHDSIASRRANALLITAFAIVAVILAALGVYAVVAHSVMQRRKELGIRVALGATNGNLLMMTSREIVIVVMTAVSLGLFAAWFAGSLLKSLVYGVSVHDPATFIIGPAALALVAMTAAFVPLLRALRVNLREVIQSQ